MDAHTASGQYPIIDEKAASSRTSTPIGRPVQSKAPYEGRYEALWIERGKDELTNMKDLYKWLTQLESELGSAAEVKRYLQWVKGIPLKRPTYVLSAYELALDLEKAEWIEANSALLTLNSRLTYSNTVRPKPLEELKATYKGYRLGLQIYGMPIAPTTYADRKEYWDKGVAVNSELLLAVSYDPSIDPTDLAKPKKTTILFVSLGHILIKSQISGEWSMSGLVLVAEVQDDGRAGSLHLIFPHKGYDTDEPETYIRPPGYSVEEWKEVRIFRGSLPFTIAKLEGGFALLKGNAISPDGTIRPTVLSDLPVEIVETGVMYKGEPSMSFPLYPEDQSR